MSGLIPRPFIDELLHRTDIVQLIDSYVPLKKRGNSYLACCPFHNEKTPSFNVIAKKQFYHCFGCGASGNAISFIISYLNQGFVDAVETLASRAGMTVPREGGADKNQHTISLYALLDEVSKHYQHTLKHAGKEAISYLQQRGVSGEVAKRFQLGYAPPDWNALENRFKAHKVDLITTGMLIEKEDGKTYDRYRHRIMFPIHDRHGRIIGFGGRAIDAYQKPKYLNSPETIIFQKSRELYGLHQILELGNPVDHILVVEGYMDVIALAQHGLPNATAALGTATSTYHIQLLSKHTRQLVFCFDGDEAGKKAAWRALENSLPILESGLDARFIFLPDGHDPDSLVRLEGKVAFLERIKKATPLHDYFLDTLAKEVDVHSLAGKTQLINNTKPYLETIPDSSFKELLINELSRITHIDSHRIAQLIKAKEAKALPKESQKTISRSPVRLAVALIIQHPEIFVACKDQIDIKALDDANQHVLQSLLHEVSLHPEINTAMLLETFRDTALFDSLSKLAGWDHQVPEEALIKEFIDIVNFLQKQNIENKIEDLIAKSRKEGLTNSERMNLQEMLVIKKQVNVLHDKK